MRSRVALLIAPGLVLAASLAVGPRTEHETRASARDHAWIEGLVFSDHAADGSSRVLRIERIERVPGRVGFFRMPLLDQLELQRVELSIDGKVVERVEALRVGGLASPPPPGAVRLAREAHALLERLPIPPAAPR